MLAHQRVGSVMGLATMDGSVNREFGIHLLDNSPFIFITDQFISHRKGRTVASQGIVVEGVMYVGREELQFSVLIIIIVVIIIIIIVNLSEEKHEINNY